MRGTEYAILEIVWWMLAAAGLGFFLGWLVHRFLLQRGLERDYQAKLGTAHEQSAQLREELNEWKLSVSALDKQLIKTGADLTSTRDQAAEKAAGLEARTRELKEAQSVIEKLQAKLDELQNEVAAVRGDLETAAEGSSRLESTIESLRQDLEAAQHDAAETESRLDTIVEEKQGEITRLTADAAAVPSLTEQVEERSLRIGDLENRLDRSRERLGNLEEQLTTIKEEHSGCEAGLTERNERIARLEAQLAAMLQEQATTPAELEERDERIAELETQLSAAVQEQAESAAELHERDERITQLENRLGIPRHPASAYPDKQTAMARMIEISERTRGASAPADDDLKEIHGIGPKLEQLLKSLGITSFRQVANFQVDDIVYVSAALSAFPGRIERDNWMASSAEQHRKKYGEPP